MPLPLHLTVEKLENISCPVTWPGNMLTCHFRIPKTPDMCHHLSLYYYNEWTPNKARFKPLAVYITGLLSPVHSESLPPVF